MMDKLIAYRLVLAPLGMGAACFLVVAALIDARAGEGAVWFAWLTSTTVAAALAGWLWPAHWLRSGGLIMLAQLPCMFVATALSGEISKPSGPMGGLVAVFIGSTLLLFWTPVPLLAAGLSARARRRRGAALLGAVFERVYTVTDYCDGPRGGVADLGGEPHLYEAEWSDDKSGHVDTFLLTPIDRGTFALAMEEWAIWRRWEAAFNDGLVDQSSHPALPEDRPRYLELKALLSGRLVTDRARAVRRRARFRVRREDAHAVPGRIKRRARAECSLPRFARSRSRVAGLRP